MVSSEQLIYTTPTKSRKRIYMTSSKKNEALEVIIHGIYEKKILHRHIMNIYICGQIKMTPSVGRLILKRNPRYGSLGCFLFIPRSTPTFVWATTVIFVQIFYSAQLDTRRSCDNVMTDIAHM